MSGTETEHYKWKTLVDDERSEQAARIARLESELRKADELLITMHSVSLGFDATFCSREQWEELCGWSAQNKEKIKDRAAARARLTSNSAERRED